MIVAFVGLPSAGKSSLINSIVGQRILQSGICRTTTDILYVGEANKLNISNFYEHIVLSDDNIKFDIMDLPGICDSEEKDNKFNEMTYAWITHANIVFWVSDVNKAFLTSHELIEYNKLKKHLKTIEDDTGSIYQIAIILSKCDMDENSLVEGNNNENIQEGNEIMNGIEDTTILDLIKKVREKLTDDEIILFNAFGRCQFKADISSTLKNFVMKQGSFQNINISFYLKKYVEYVTENEHIVYIRSFERNYDNYLKYDYSNHILDAKSKKLALMLKKIHDVYSIKYYNKIFIKLIVSLSKNRQYYSDTTNTFLLILNKYNKNIEHLYRLNQELLKYLSDTTNMLEYFNTIFLRDVFLDNVYENKLVLQHHLNILDNMSQCNNKDTIETIFVWKVRILQIGLYYKMWTVDNDIINQINALDELQLPKCGSQCKNLSDQYIVNKIYYIRKKIYPYENMNITIFMTLYLNNKVNLYDPIYPIWYLIIIYFMKFNIDNDTYNKVNEKYPITQDFYNCYGYICIKDFKNIPEKFRIKELCKMAVKKYRSALKYVPDSLKTKELCEIAMKNKNSLDSSYCPALKYVPDSLKTKELCEMAIRNENSLEYVLDSLKTKELCEMAIKNNCSSLGDVPDSLKTKELCEIGVQHDCEELKYVPDSLKTKELCEIAVQHNGWAFEYVPDSLKTSELCEMSITFIDEQTIDNEWGCACGILEHIPENLRSDKICRTMVLQKYCFDDLQYVPDKYKTKEFCDEFFKLIIPLMYESNISDFDDYLEAFPINLKDYIKKKFEFLFQT